jgi:hypothetical protein
MTRAHYLDPILPERFWSKTTIDPETGCWLWTASTSEGYGAFGVRKGLIARAHRVTYTTLVGEVPAGLDLDHLCRTRRCCNPAHLEPVTRRVNLLRGNTVNARTHCPKGHPYDAVNTNVINVRGGGKYRQCRACNRANCAAWQARKKLANQSK